MKINMNIRNEFGRLCIPILALGVFFASCTDELSSEVVPGGGGKGGESEVTLKLQVPGTAAGAKTRAVEQKDENEIDDLYVLAFKVAPDDGQETFDYYVAAKYQSTQGDNNELSRWTASLKVKDYQQRFVMIANTQGTTSKVNEQIGALAGNSVGHSKMEMLAKLTEALSEDEKTGGFNAAASGNHHPFTMYGQTGKILITENGNGGHSLSVSMHRIMAQVRMTFTGNAADDTKFEAESVLLYNFNDRARVIPDNFDDAENDSIETPTIPQGAVLLPAKVDGEGSVPTYAVDQKTKKIEHAIYLFETAQPETGTELEKHVKRPCLIVKGRYKGTNKDATCYYRVDLQRPDAAGDMSYLHVLRNHSYNVTIKDVTGPGHDTPQEALESKPANITATVIGWDETEIGGLDFDGQHALGIGTMKYQLGLRGGNNLLQQVKASAGLKWTATLYEADEYGQATDRNPDWISFAGNKHTIVGEGTDEAVDHTFTVLRNQHVPERRAVMRFTARNLQVDALVVQDQSNPVYINVKIGDKVITEEEFEQMGGWCREMTIEYGPQHTDLEWRYTGDINLIQTNDGDGETGDTDGKTNSREKEDATMTWKGKAQALTGVDEKPYATRNGVLTLIAKGAQGMEAKSIRLFQKKYGVRLENTTVPCTGKVRQVRVIGNMPWTAEMDEQTITDAKERGYLKDVAGGWNGIETEKWVDAGNLSFNTAKQNVKAGNMDVTITFKHATNTKILPINIPITLLGCLVVPGNPEKLYEVHGPVDRSWYERATDIRDDAGNVVEKAYMISNEDGKMLAEHGEIDDWEMTTDTRIELSVASYMDTKNLNLQHTNAYKRAMTFTMWYDGTKADYTQRWVIATFVKRSMGDKIRAEDVRRNFMIGPPSGYKSPFGWHITFHNGLIGPVQPQGYNAYPAFDKLYSASTTAGPSPAWPALILPDVHQNADITLTSTSWSGPVTVIFWIENFPVGLADEEAIKKKKYKTYYLKSID